MGQDIEHIQFTQADYALFSQRLQSQVSILGSMCQEQRFSEDTYSFGAEVEMYIVNDSGQPLSINSDISNDAQLDNLTLELNQYNLEYNFDPITQAHSAPFSALEQQWIKAYQRLEKTAQSHQARLLTIGILPTLARSNLGSDFISPKPRYFALDKALRAQRRALPFTIALAGEDHINVSLEDVSAEGANTSFQFHYRCPFSELPRLYNMAQLLCPLVLAVSGNSPFFLGQRLWQETRIGLFKQSVDTRLTQQRMDHVPDRVYFGMGWLRQSIDEIFAQNVSLFEPLLPVCDTAPESAPSCAPRLAELRLHHSCVWPWNRPVYDPAGGGHIRLELRALPSGPTAVDMLANAALSIGLMEGLMPWHDTLLNSTPFHIAESNFYRAARHGLATELLWPDMKKGSLEHPLGPLKSTPTSELLIKLLPYAYQGLEKIGIEASESEKYLDVIKERLLTKQTGAQWQLNQYESLLKKNHSPESALQTLVHHYHQLSHNNQPVHSWPLF